MPAIGRDLLGARAVLTEQTSEVWHRKATTLSVQVSVGGERS
jgi:hypothetical protein